MKTSFLKAHCKRGVFAAFTLLALVLPAAASESESLTGLPPGRPVKVTLGVELAEVSQIQDHDEKFEIEFYLFLGWHDPRLAFSRRDEGREKRIVPIDQIWTPQPELMDDLDVSVQDGRNAHIHPDGSVRWRQYYRGTISSNFNLHEFPFDRHRLEVHIEANSGEIDDVVYVAGESHVREEASDTLHVVPHGWALLGMTTDVTEARYDWLGETFSRFVFSIDVKRDPHFYWWAIVIPLLPIVATSWSVFWMDPKEFSSQVGVGVTAMLTVVAYRITIDSSLPPLSYMTRMDYFLLVCQVWVFGAFLMTIVVHVCLARNTAPMVATAHRISRYCRWLPPVALVVTCSLLALVWPAVAMSVLVGTSLAIILSRRPTPARVCHWIKVALFPERFLAGPSLEAAEENSLRSAA